MKNNVSPVIRRGGDSGQPVGDGAADLRGRRESREPATGNGNGDGEIGTGGPLAWTSFWSVPSRLVNGALIAAVLAPVPDYVVFYRCLDYQANGLNTGRRENEREVPLVIQGPRERKREKEGWGDAERERSI